MFFTIANYSLFCFFSQCIFSSFGLGGYQTNAALKRSGVCRRCGSLPPSRLRFLICLLYLRQLRHVYAWHTHFWGLRNLNTSEVSKLVIVFLGCKLHFLSASHVGRTCWLLFKKASTIRSLKSNSTFWGVAGHRIKFSWTCGIHSTNGSFQFQSDSLLHPKEQFVECRHNLIANLRLLRLQDLHQFFHLELRPSLRLVNNCEPGRLSLRSEILFVLLHLLLHLPLVKLNQSGELFLLGRLEVLSLVQSQLLHESAGQFRIEPQLD